MTALLNTFLLWTLWFVLQMATCSRSCKDKRRKKNQYNLLLRFEYELPTGSCAEGWFYLRSTRKEKELKLEEQDTVSVATLCSGPPGFLVTRMHFASPQAHGDRKLRHCEPLPPILFNWSLQILIKAKKNYDQLWNYLILITLSLAWLISKYKNFNKSVRCASCRLF